MLIVKTCLSPIYRKGWLKTYILCLKAHLEIQTKFLLSSNYRMFNIIMKKVQFSAVTKKVTFHHG